MSHPTARTHAAVSAAVVVGVLAVATILLAIGMVKFRKAKFVRKTQLLHSRSNSTGREPHPMAMANYQSGPASVRLPNSPARVYDPGSSIGTSPRSVYHPSSSNILSPQDPAQYNPTDSAPHCGIAQPQASSPNVSPFIEKVDFLEDAAMTQSESIVAVPSQAAVTVHAIGHVNTTKSRLLRFLPGQLLNSSTFMPQLLSPPLTPTSPTLFLPSESSRHNAELDTGFKFPSPPPKSTVSTLNNMFGFNRHSSGLIVQDHEKEDHVIWIDVFSLEDYRREDSFVCAYSSASILDLLPSPPPTPTVFFTPPSPPSLPTPASSPVKVDKGRLHVWRPTTKPKQVIKTDQKSESDEEDEDESAYSYNGLTLFTLAHEQAKVAQARRCAQFGIWPNVKTASNFRDDSLPPYQTLGFDYESRLARKRASSPFAEAPIPVKSTTRIFLNQVTTFVRPRPPLEEFKPLLCRKVDSSRFHSRPAFPGFSEHAPTIFRNVAISRDHIGLGKEALYATTTMSELETPPACKGAHIGQESVMKVSKPREYW